MEQPLDKEQTDHNAFSVDILQSDKSLQNIIETLNHYQTILNAENYDTSICEYAQQNRTILHDYITILRTYLSNTVHQNNETFEQIHNIISKQIKCDIKHCKPYARNNRDRTRQSIKTENDHDVQMKSIFYSDLLDNIHCYFLHSYDTGFRMKYTQLAQLQQPSKQAQYDENKQQNLDNNAFIADYIHDGMKNITSFLEAKRQSLRDIRGAKRAQYNKFSTYVNTAAFTETESKNNIDDNECIESDTNDMKTSDDDDENEMSSFNFGYRYYYWKQDKFVDKWFIPKTMCKYSSLKDEIINNKLYTLPLYAYELALEKATQFKGTDYIKKLRANNILCRYYEVEKDSVMSLQHVLSLIFYTDFDLLSNTFSSTFRRSNKDNINDYILKQRNAEYWHWSKALRESVELWGTALNSKENQYTIFYHGTSYLIFDKLVAKFSSPTSTTSSIQVASIFAKGDGIILELEKYSGYGSDLRYFDMSILSTFTNESEMLFFGGKKPLKLGGIRNIAENENYRIFFNALTICQIAVRGMNNTVVSKPMKRDYGIIDRLCKHQQNEGTNKEYTNKFPLYINKLFKMFADNQMTLVFSFNNMSKYKGILNIFGVKGVRGLLTFDYLLKTFTKCQYITITQCAVATFRIKFTAIFGDALLQICDNINTMDSCEIDTILYRRNVEFEEDERDIEGMINKYEERFAQKNWTLYLYKHKAKKGSNFKATVDNYTMTIKKGHSDQDTNVDKKVMAKLQNRKHSLLLVHSDAMKQGGKESVEVLDTDFME